MESDALSIGEPLQQVYKEYDIPEVFTRWYKMTREMDSTERFIMLMFLRVLREHNVTHLIITFFFSLSFLSMFISMYVCNMYDVMLYVYLNK